MNNLEERLKQLEQEIGKLEAENKALLKLASHDLRSPLNKIFALVNLMKMTDDPLSSEQQGYLKNIELVLSDSLQRMRNLTELRSIENNLVEVNWERVSIAPLVKKMALEYTPSAERKNIKLTTELESVETTSDKLLLTRVLDQLISNAIKFSSESSEIKITLEGSQEKFCITVIDGGYGIEQKEQAKLFKKFSVLSTRATAGESTTGIGLYIAQEIAIKLGGRIVYDNKNGSEFTLEMPYVSLA